MKLVLHMGLHKTGTTSFQDMCADNRDVLREHGILYPNYDDGTQHSPLAWEIQRSGLEVASEFFRDCAEMAKDGCSTVLLSGEDFENCIVDVSFAREIEEEARRAGFLEIVWVVTTRRFEDLVASFYAQKSKRGVVLNFHTVHKAATERGCFYISTKEYDYIHVFDYERFSSRFSRNITGEIIHYDFADFVEKYPGRKLLQQLLSKESLKNFEKNVQIDRKHINKRLKLRTVEENYSANALQIGRLSGVKNVIRPLLAPLVWLRKRSL